MKPIEIIWFENISAFNEQVLGLGGIRVSMKQLLFTFLALGLALSLLNFAKNLILAVLIPSFLLMLAFVRPYNIGMEELLIDMVSFFSRKKSIGAVEDKKEKDKSKKEKEDKDKVSSNKETEIPITTTATATPDTVTIVTPTTAVTEPDLEIPVTSVIPVTRSNLLHYIVPLSKDFNLEITDKEYVIATGESTIHISKDTVNAIIAIEIKDNAVARITVNKHP
ncbi:hypothetical protein [Candidatus Nitrosocaldus islandicus]|uniref:hypothetical protein n=1 Tax=Candidatus Nitrosocaldus islandicus TaxID=2045011 RepID=UPI000CD0F14F|nr:hypothetical protein [Candidatus Nitrosocaldus islandicus]